MSFWVKQSEIEESNRHNYNLKETHLEVDRVKNLTEKFDPIEVSGEDKIVEQ